MWNNCEAEVSNMGCSHGCKRQKQKCHQFPVCQAACNCTSSKSSEEHTHTHTQWLTLLTAVQMQTEIPSQRHWEWPSGCYSVAASPPSCHPAHSLSSMPLIVLGRGGPFLLTSLSCSCFSRGQPWGRETVGRVWMSPVTQLRTAFDHLQPHTSLLSGRRHQLRRTWDEELWQYPTTQGGQQYTGGGACGCCRRAKDCLWVSYCSYCCGVAHFHTTDQDCATLSHLMFFQYSNQGLHYNFFLTAKWPLIFQNYRTDVLNGNIIAV